MKPVTTCCNCSLAARVMRAGFTATPGLYCTMRGDEPVEADDGCTFGAGGEPTRARMPYGVELGEHAATGGWSE